MHDHVKGCIRFWCKEVDRNKDGQLCYAFWNSTCNDNGKELSQQFFIGGYGTDWKEWSTLRNAWETGKEQKRGRWSDHDWL